MKFVVFLLLIFFTLGCVEKSPYKEILPSELISNPEIFEGKKVCIDGNLENNSISGILIVKIPNYTNGTLANVCGNYKDGKLQADFINSILSISTEKDIYRSNETLRVHINFASERDAEVQLVISGIKNEFDRALISETRNAAVTKGVNGFDFEFKTPSCEECAALSPGIYTLSASVKIDAETFETYKKITLEREE